MNAQEQVGPPSPKTEANIKAARAHSCWCGPAHIEWKVWTGGFRVLPRWELMTTEFWHEGPVRWWRGYWLTLGLSIYWSLPERRGPNRMSGSKEDILRAQLELIRQGRSEVHEPVVYGVQTSQPENKESEHGGT
jgi:hypothetical protein